QLDRAVVLERTAPPRAASLLDFERLALDVPGTRVARARAFGGVDGRYPGLVAPGTVTVAVVAGVPRRAPVPTQELLDAIAAFLRRRKTLGTRLVVVGPTYVEVAVDATLVVGAGADPARVQADAVAKLVGYLDPITGGPAGRGWPFGRDVYRSEMLQLLDGVDGVDHVSALDLRDPGGASCGNVCIPSTGLPVSGTHTIAVSP
ncbi:MAG TPA: baseplate J/gp47 family protein, partial [Gaiellaceae bacterium]